MDLKESQEEPAMGVSLYKQMVLSTHFDLTSNQGEKEIGYYAGTR